MISETVDVETLPGDTAPLTEPPQLGMTEAAAAEFARLRLKRNKPTAVLRVRVADGGGCGDYRYAMGIEPGPRRGDFSLAFHGITLIVDPRSAAVLQGSTIDFSDSLMDGGFKIQNPNAKSSCGCGQSFSTTGRAIESKHAGRGGLG